MACISAVWQILNYLLSLFAQRVTCLHSCELSSFSFCKQVLYCKVQSISVLAKKRLICNWAFCLCLMTRISMRSRFSVVMHSLVMDCKVSVRLTILQKEMLSWHVLSEVLSYAAWQIFSFKVLVFRERVQKNTLNRRPPCGLPWFFFCLKQLRVNKLSFSLIEILQGFKTHKL